MRIVVPEPQRNNYSAAPATLLVCGLPKPRIRRRILCGISTFNQAHPALVRSWAGCAYIQKSVDLLPQRRGSRVAPGVGLVLEEAFCWTPELSWDALECSGVLVERRRHGLDIRKLTRSSASLIGSKPRRSGENYTVPGCPGLGWSIGIRTFNSEATARTPSILQDYTMVKVFTTCTFSKAFQPCRT